MSIYLLYGVPYEKEFMNKEHDNERAAKDMATTPHQQRQRRVAERIVAGRTITSIARLLFVFSPRAVPLAGPSLRVLSGLRHTPLSHSSSFCRVSEWTTLLVTSILISCNGAGFQLCGRLVQTFGFDLDGVLQSIRIHV